MSNRHNQLTPAQDERLSVLAGDLAESICAIEKIRRFGYKNHHPDQPAHLNNRVALETELGHVLNAIELMLEDLDHDVISTAKVRKEKTISAYLFHQEN